MESSRGSAPRPYRGVRALLRRHLPPGLALPLHSSCAAVITRHAGGIALRRFIFVSMKKIPARSFTKRRQEQSAAQYNSKRDDPRPRLALIRAAAVRRACLPEINIQRRWRRSRRCESSMWHVPAGAQILLFLLQSQIAHFSHHDGAMTTNNTT